ncbi:hypothetical protein MXMO3_01770 [Maritalea myrionectae]|uniref:Uncharacterized protein n=1 Tax=Maritalea myrionectae TaxID=454601 RepID=A0A2R4MEC8_9HYPH|nr:hypothetical protein [Maritalea myrionectae]AVX04295.1 hypothetical protein MXMO3_01770 [Maritalea myrionectae]
MGDMGDYFRDWDAAKKRRKGDRLSDAEAMDWPCEWKKHTEHHWSTVLNVHRLDYWPSTGKWIWCAEKYRGDAQSLARFIEKRQRARELEKQS